MLTTIPPIRLKIVFRIKSSNLKKSKAFISVQVTKPNINKVITNKYYHFLKHVFIKKNKNSLFQRSFLLTKSSPFYYFKN